MPAPGLTGASVLSVVSVGIVVSVNMGVAVDAPPEDPQAVMKVKMRSRLILLSSCFHFIIRFSFLYATLRVPYVNGREPSLAGRCRGLLPALSVTFLKHVTVLITISSM
jgi:hypothetical protein